VEKTNKQLSKQPSKELASVLSNASATPALITQTISSLSLARLERELTQRTQLEQELANLRASWLRVPTARPEIEKKAQGIKAWLNQIPNRLPLAEAYHTEPERTSDDLILIFCWMNEQVNISQTMTEAQMTQAALMMIYSFPLLRLEDVAILIRQGLTGHYGAVYNRIDVTVLSDWARQYWESLREQRIDRAWGRHLSSKEDPTAPRSGDADRAAFREAYTNYLKTGKAQ